MNDGRREARPAYIGIGSNLDDPVAQVERALSLLEAIPDTRLVSRSSLYESAPFGPVDQPNFVNAVAKLLTFLDAPALLLRLQEIELARGRVRSKHWGPRVIDLDLLVFGQEEIDEPKLTVPHPGIGERNFVLLPLREIAPELVIPQLGCVAEIAVDENEPQISLINP